MNGLRGRQHAIAQACDSASGGIVRHLDIKRFYPSIGYSRALSVWTAFCTEADLDKRILALGTRLLEGHAKIQPNSMLTGPMLSHLIGNLVLRDIDVATAAQLPCEYFRYVDDIVLVGAKSGVDEATGILARVLERMDFTLHSSESEKFYDVPVEEWVAARNDYADTELIVKWKSFIHDLKRLLLERPGEAPDLYSRLLADGFRIPVRDYSAAVRQPDFLAKVRTWAGTGWLKRRRLTTSMDLLRRAHELRDQLMSEFDRTLSFSHDAAGFHYRRLTSKLRYYVGRLTYLGSDEQLRSVAAQIADVHDLAFHAIVARAVATGNVDDVIELGTNGAQAAAQAMRAAQKKGSLTKDRLGPTGHFGLAVFAFNGVAVQWPGEASAAETPLLEFALRGGTPALMRHEQPFVREIACLHGIIDTPRHPAVFEQVFADSESDVLDAVALARESFDQ